MAICEKCGKEYLTKECLRCQYKPNTKKYNDKVDNKLLLIPATLIILIAILSYKIFFTNPILGTWQSEQKNFMGIKFGNKIEFTKDKMIMMGIISNVKYEIDGDNIYVIDKTGTGMLFKMIDKNTMYSELMGIKTKYKRIN